MHPLIKASLAVSLFLVIVLLVSLIRTVHRLEENEFKRKQGSAVERNLGSGDNSKLRAVTPMVPVVMPTRHPLPPPTARPNFVVSIINSISRPEISRSKNQSSTHFRQYGQLAAMTNKKIRNIVVGLTYKTSDESFAIFSGSLKMNVKTADCVIFVESPVSSRYLEIASRNDVVLVEYEMGQLVPDFINKYHASSIRWILFHQYFEQMEQSLKGKYDKMMFTDARDVAFEDDPFKDVPMDTSLVFQEGVPMGNPISQCGWNSGWIKDCMGQRILAAVQNNNIICSGVSFTSYLQGKAYLRLVSSIMLGESDLSRYFPSCERNGVDQGVHNVVVHLDLLPNMHVKSELDFPLVNLQNSQIWNRPGVKLSELLYSFVNPNNQMANKKYAVIHQFDRIASLTLELARKYVYWKNYDNAVWLWKNESTCDAYNTHFGSDLFMGQCDIGGSRVFSAEQCCHLCTTMAKCRGFAFTESVCYFKSCERGSVNEQTAAQMDTAKSSSSNLKTSLGVGLNLNPNTVLMTAFV